MARYYDASIGRFINRDAFHGFEDKPQSLNLYIYANNNPTNRIDPSGHLSFGKKPWNKVSSVALVFNLLITFVPAFWAVGSAFKAKLAAQKLAAAAGRKALEQVKNRSRKVIIEMFVEAQKELAKRSVPQFGNAIKGFVGAIVEGLFSIIGSSPGEIIANQLDKLDGKKDGYIFA